MSVFICWSEDRSREVALCLQEVLKTLKLGAKMSPDIAKGEIWFQRITESLQTVEAGIVVLTPENLQSPWLHFEAGALAMKMRKSEEGLPPIYPYLFHPEPLPITGPLSQYQITLATKSETLKMVNQLRRLLAQNQSELSEKQWEKHWTVLSTSFRFRAATLPPTRVVPELEAMFNRKTFHEPVQKCVSRAWLDRYLGARSTHEELKRVKPVVDIQCRPYARALLEQLMQATDRYAMAIRALLLEERKYPLNSQGDLVLLPRGIQEACEAPRIEALRLQADLVADELAPAQEESSEFERLDGFAPRKDVVHRKEAELRRAFEAKPKGLQGQIRFVRRELDKLDRALQTGRARHGSAVPGRRHQLLLTCVKRIQNRLRTAGGSPEWWKPPFLSPDEAIEKAATSVWPLDRILYYVVRREEKNTTLDEAIGFVSLEWEKARALIAPDPLASRMPLHYALDVLDQRLTSPGRPPLPPEQRDDLLRLFEWLEVLERGIPESRISERVRELMRFLGPSAKRRRS